MYGSEKVKTKPSLLNFTEFPVTNNNVDILNQYDQHYSVEHEGLIMFCLNPQFGSTDHW